MEKRLLQFFILLLLVFGAWRVWNPLWKYDLNEAVSLGRTKKTVFSIEKGSSAKHIAEELEDAELIVNEVSFIRTVKKEDLEGSLRYGRFVLSPSMTLREIITVLTTEGSGEQALTVIEGWTIEDIDQELSNLGLIEAGNFQTCTTTCSFDYEFLPEGKSLEGFLFPDTYFLDSSDFSSESLTNSMLKNFDEKWTEQMQIDLLSSGRTLEEVVNVASMLEKEVRTPDDIPIVAGIIWKRLDNDWYLGIDATLLYKDEDGVLSPEELTEEDVYNTRVMKGLPPTPIGNPGLNSLKGALYPESSDYWFYLTDSEGEVHYATTNEEHAENKVQYLN